MRRFRKNIGGFTLMELVAAMGISGFLILAIYSLLTTSLQENVKSDASNEGWLEATTAGTMVSLIFKNVARIVPAEDFESNGDGLYEGIAPLDATSAPADCKVGEDFSAIRVTSIGLKLPSAVLRKAWYTNMADGAGTANELRLSYLDAAHPEIKSMFSTNEASNPTELFLVDADGVSKRRYSVDTVTIHDDTNVNPATGLVEVGKHFRYVSVNLLSPHLTTGSPEVHLSPEIGFITDSVAYPSRTSVICVTKGNPVTGADSTLTEIYGSTKHALVNLDHFGSPTSKSRLQLKKFKVDFLASEKVKRFDALTPMTDYLTNPSRKCMDAVKFDIEIGLKADLKDADAKWTPVKLSRTVLLPNFINGRAVGCN